LNCIYFVLLLYTSWLLYIFSVLKL
jgi:hypothetical protein